MDKSVLLFTDFFAVIPSVLLILMLRRYDHWTCPAPPFLMIHLVVSYPLIVVYSNLPT